MFSITLLADTLEEAVYAFEVAQHRGLKVESTKRTVRELKVTGNPVALYRYVRFLHRTTV